MPPSLSAPSGFPAVSTVGELSVVAGPDAGRLFPVAAGRWVLGRATSCDFTIRDDRLELHHLLLEVRSTGVVWLTQLSGRLAILVDGQPTERAVLTGTGADIELAATRLEWKSAPAKPTPTPAPATSKLPTIGVVDSADRAFGPDTGGRSRSEGQIVALPPDVQELTIVGSDIGPCLRAIVGQLAQLAWSVQSTHHEAPCMLTRDAATSPTDQPRRRVVVVDASQSGDAGFNFERLSSDLVITVTDDETGLDATGKSGAVIAVGGRSRGRYTADAGKLATVRLHLVGWHPTTFASTVNGVMSGSIPPR